MTVDIKNSNSHKTTTENDILDLVKGDGPWQRLTFLVSLICSIALATHNLVMSFYAPNIDHWCARPPGMNITVDEWKTLALPPGDQRCSRYSFVNFSNLNTNVNHTQDDIIPCVSWEYDDSVYVSTVLGKWDLVCDREWFVSLSKAIFTTGYLLSVAISGYLADKFGRRPVIGICNAIALIFAVISVFSTSFLMFAVLRFFIALGVAGALNTMFVLLMEVVGPNYRTYYGLGINFGWCFGFTSLPLIAWLLRDWFWIQMVITAPSVFLIFSWWLLSESPRWLLSQGRIKEAEEVLIRAAKMNGVPVTDIGKKLNEIMSQKSKVNEPESSSGNVFDLLRTPGLRNKTLNLFYLWCIIAFMYFGISFNTNEMAGDPFVNFAASGAIEIPANIICIIIVKSLGRRNPLSAFLIIGAIACFAMYPLPADPWWLNVIVALTGKFCITAAFSIIYVYTAELFPTVVRNVGIGSASLCGRVGSIVAPFVRELGNATHPVVPQLIFGILAAIGGISVLILPETINCRVPDTLMEAEHFTRKRTPINVPNHMKLKEMNFET